MSSRAKKRSVCSALMTFVIVPLVAAIVMIPILRTRQAGDSLLHIIPNALLFTSYREEARSFWNQFNNIDRSIKRAPIQIPIIDAKDYSFESLRTATENFRYPAIVRGLFIGSNAEKRWTDPEYLSSRIGEFIIPVVSKATYGTLQNERELLPFRTAYTEIVEQEDSKKYLFFPVESRSNFNHSDVGSAKELRKRINQVVREDLDLDRIWPGFGGPNHKSFFGSQLVVGRGSNDSDATTGTGWHCAGGNNWFAQVTGRKRWYFMDPKYSSQMYPLRGGKVNMQTGNRNMAELHDHIPLRYSDVIAGDLLYNPDWEWHTIKNYEGLSIGVPIREVNISLSLQNNLQYTLILLTNKVLDKFGIDIGGYPPS
mmetsp:Transcript_15368/g.23137  ORF Transcript_15368/g.23137 Transcript_15368/m.23137 type:complete len:369 (+) Transcript_15368:50-1156(+)|eukprot:CAMPEP_0185024774 /NCGR_PEP_ID=MMETSP1103-20130426/7981_1 /TAXON_ID=36769 /ORGANISM="Paraphysomonas bandaiensis, Strain Caron Lab Isolate" /LENGTH=368 /DNA_ID=CAMNT_0027557837 /DNA_START=46 /DNA_END=1152 /DNA_ORIENTATION=+